jgi:hypothetical protein
MVHFVAQGGIWTRYSGGKIVSCSNMGRQLGGAANVDGQTTALDV